MKVITGQNRVLGLGICFVVAEIMVVVGLKIREHVLIKRKEAAELGKE